MSAPREAALIRAMPIVFVLIWSTGFIVARYAMPHAPPLTFLAMRYFLSIACFLFWIVLARVNWPVGRAQWAHLALTGVLMHAFYLGGVWMAVKAGMGSGLSALIAQVGNGTAPADLQSAFAKVAADLQPTTATTTPGSSSSSGTTASTPQATLQALLTQLQQNLGYGASSSTAAVGNFLSAHA